MIDLWALDDAGLDVYQFRMVVHVARVGVSWEGLRTLADICRMSVGKASETKQWLIDNGYLVPGVDKRTGKTGWKVADLRMVAQDDGGIDTSECSPHEQGVHHMNTGVHHMNTGVHHMNTGVHHMNTLPEVECSPHEQKNNLRQHIKTTHEEGAPAPDAQSIPFVADDEIWQTAVKLVQRWCERRGIFATLDDQNADDRANYYGPAVQLSARVNGEFISAWSMIWESYQGMLGRGFVPIRLAPVISQVLADLDRAALPPRASPAGNGSQQYSTPVPAMLPDENGFY